MWTVTLTSFGVDHLGPPPIHLLLNLIPTSGAHLLTIAASKRMRRLDCPHGFSATEMDSSRSLRYALRATQSRSVESLSREKNVITLAVNIAVSLSILHRLRIRFGVRTMCTKGSESGAELGDCL